MKVAVSIPDSVFGEAELLTKRLNTSRSEIYTRALHAFVGQYSPDRVTAALDAIADTDGGEDNGAAATAARRVFDRVEW